MSGKLRYESQNNLPTSLFYSRSREKTYPFILGWVHPAHSRHSPLLIADVVSLTYSFKRENSPFLGTPEMSGKLRYECRLYLHTFTAPIALCSPIFSLLSCRSREKTIYTPLYPLPGNSRNEWQIEIWVANHFKIFYPYYIWSLSWTTYYLTMRNNPFGEKNNSTFSIALDDPSSILIKVLCIFAPTIIPTSLLTLLSYNAHTDLSNTTTMMMREKRILIILLN